MSFRPRASGDFTAWSGLFTSVARTSIALTVAVMVVTGVVVLAAGGGALEALVWAVALALATRVVPILASFPIAWWPRAGHRVPPLGAAGAARTVAREVWATVKLFFFYHPFEKLITGREPARIFPGETPVVLVHGFYSNAAFWHPMKPALRAAGWRNLFAVTLEPPFADIDELAGLLEARIDDICDKCGCESLIVVAHSMGGLVTRTCIRRRPGRIRHVICVATPHRGTMLASLVPADNTRQMRRGSKWLNELGRDGLSAALCTNIYSEHDNIIVPQSSAAPAGAGKIGLRGIGHLDMAFSREVLEKIQHVLMRVGGRAQLDKSP